MPVFINEVVIRAAIERPAPAGGATAAPAETGILRESLVTEVRQAVMDYLERELDRFGER